MKTFYFTETVQREYFVEANSKEEAFKIVSDINYKPYDEFSEGVAFIEEVTEEE